MPERKRCPNGTRKNHKTGKCVKKTQKIQKIQKVCPPEKPLLNPITNRCLKDTTANRKKVENLNIVKNIAAAKKERKECPPEKPLYNPKTNRCIQDSAANLKRIKTIEETLDKERSKHEPIIKNKSITPKKIQFNITSSNKTYTVENCPNTIFNNIDINNVGIGLDKNNKDTFYYKDGKTYIPLTEKQFLGDGSFGAVYRLYDKSQKYNVALKTYYNNHDNEIKILKQLKVKNVDCNLLSCSLLQKSNGNYISICELYSNNLVKLQSQFKKMTIEEKLKIFKQLTNDLYCLYKKGFAYTDIKLENTLYKCINKNKIKIAFGDLGSICNIGKTIATISNPPFESRKDLFNTKCNEKTVIWGLGVMFLTILLNREFISHLEWTNFEYITKENYLEIRNKLLSRKIRNGIKNNKGNYITFKNYVLDKTTGLTLYDFIEQMLMYDPNFRTSFKTVLKNLNKY